MSVTSSHSPVIDDFVERARAHWRVPGVAVAAVPKGEPIQHLERHAGAALTPD